MTECADDVGWVVLCGPGAQMMCVVGREVNEFVGYLDACGCDVDQTDEGK